MTVLAIPDVVVLEPVDVHLELAVVHVHVRHEEIVFWAIRTTAP